MRRRDKSLIHVRAQRNPQKNLIKQIFFHNKEHFNRRQRIKRHMQESYAPLAI
jgi:hypothetical protein